VADKEGNLIVDLWDGRVFLPGSGGGGRLVSDPFPTFLVIVTFLIKTIDTQGNLQERGSASSQINDEKREGLINSFEGWKRYTDSL